MKRITYRKLKNYKYQLKQQYKTVVPIYPLRDIKTTFIELDKNGFLIVKKGYSWDGPSGPTIDTSTFMRGSLVHDALYQLIRMGFLDKSLRIKCDKVLKDICLEDKMAKWRAWYVYISVKRFGKYTLRPRKSDHDITYFSPEKD